ncbi:thermonuclease family protein [Nitrogeniibacter aestuarii]|uniref:thermonuclease family protein n=1 Tax=Nitrogeniibacter aestuarii TaxID=2815343 RepID=UPI001D12722B|nr:hypothetical protein [Nitrogeniibacter aestuarii]
MRRPSRRWARPLVAACVSVVLLAAPPAFADFTGKVIKIGDGDTATTLRGTDSIRVRLAEIDAPEKSQPVEPRSRQSLADLVFDKAITW